MESAWADAVFVPMTAHELRLREGRKSLFRELARVLAPMGTLSVVEHLRNAATRWRSFPLRNLGTRSTASCNGREGAEYELLLLEHTPELLG